MTVGAVQRFTSWLLGRSVTSPAVTKKNSSTAGSASSGGASSRRSQAEVQPPGPTKAPRPTPRPVLKVPQRPLDRTIVARAPRRILEIGLTSVADSAQMLAYAVQSAVTTDDSPVDYVAIDLFESRRPELPAISVKHAHRGLRSDHVRRQLIPGDPYVALMRNANSLGKFDLCIINTTVDAASLEHAWFYFPRMLHSESLVLMGQPDGTYQTLTLADVSGRAQKCALQRRAA